MQDFHLHLVSDSTGETVTLLARASLVHFDDIQVKEHLWPLVRTKDQVQEVMEQIRNQPGFVMCTLVNEDNWQELKDECRLHQIPCIPVLDPVVAALGAYLNAKSHPRPGRQHAMDAEYFNRIEAMQYALSHDDGQMAHELIDADVVLVGVSRTSKTPTCIYLANRGIKAVSYTHLTLPTKRIV